MYIIYLNIYIYIYKYIHKRIHIYIYTYVLSKSSKLTNITSTCNGFGAKTIKINKYNKYL